MVNKKRVRRNFILDSKSNRRFDAVYAYGHFRTKTAALNACIALMYKKMVRSGEINDDKEGEYE